MVEGTHTSELDFSASVIVTKLVIVEVVVGVEVMVLVFVATGDVADEPLSTKVVYSTIVDVTVTASASSEALAALASEAVAGTVIVVEGKVMVTYLSIVTVVSTSAYCKALAASVLLS